MIGLIGKKASFQFGHGYADPALFGSHMGEQHIAEFYDRRAMRLLTALVERSALRRHANEDEAKAARDALRKAGGKCDLLPQNQAWTEFDPDRGWVDYLTLDMWRVGFTRNYLPKVTMRPGQVSNYAITFDGGTVCATKIINAKAEELYEQHRELVKPLWRR
jgi:hypothetical protein